MAERAGLVRLVEQAHAARLQSPTRQLAGLLPVMFDWRADWRSWEHTHQLALDAARQAGDADAELAGSVALSTPEARAAYLRNAPEHELAGAPATDLCELTE